MGLILKRERGQNEDSNADITNGFCSSLLKLEKDKEASKEGPVMSPTDGKTSRYRQKAFLISLNCALYFPLSFILLLVT